MDSRQAIGRNLPRLRQARGLSQERLALITGYSRQYLSGVESGRRNPTVEVLDVLAAAIGGHGGRSSAA